MAIDSTSHAVYFTDTKTPNKTVALSHPHTPTMIASLDQADAVKPVKVSFEHEKLGGLIGWERGNDIVQFRGIPYAEIPGRFRQSKVQTSLPSQPFDATNPGSTCPHPPQDYWKYWDAELPFESPVLKATATDEFNCLNLSITIPSDVLRGTRKVPVFVFIHGGAFVGGNHAIQLHGREVFDGTGLVRHSMRLNKDMISVGINYRVGPLGFLASRELTAFSKFHGEPAGNYGLHDQRMALEWLSMFVAGFGGDPEKITIQGTSAGGASSHFLSLMPQRKFRRAILASGTGWGIGPVPESTAQKKFDELRAATCSAQDSPLEAILNLDLNKLNCGITYDVCNPLIDNVWVRRNALLPPDHMECPPAEVMVGAALREDDIAELFLRDMKTWQFKTDEDAWNFMQRVFESNNCIKTPSFPLDNADLMKSYGMQELVQSGIEKPHLDLVQHSASWAALLGHVLFNFPTYLLAERLSKESRSSKVWLYHYEARNPYPASHSRDMAHHGVNDLLLFNPGQDQIPAEHLEAWIGAVEQTQRSWIEFVNGESPWSPVRGDLSTLGPLFKFEDGQGSAEHDTLEAAIGQPAASQWEAMKNSWSF